MRLSILLAATLFLSACTTLAPGAEKVKLTRNAKDVAGCSVIGPVETPRRNDVGLGGGTEADTTMKNNAFSIGADTVFVTSAMASFSGVAYRCGPGDPRQPVPVTPK